MPVPKIGDIIYIPGHFKRRSFWGWLTNQPKEPQPYKVTAQCTSYCKIDPIEKGEVMDKAYYEAKAAENNGFLSEEDNRAYYKLFADEMGMSVDQYVTHKLEERLKGK